MFVVFDMDGTLSKPDHRVHFLTQKEKDWDAFYEACDGDLPFEPILALFCEIMRAGHKVEIWTGRRESTRMKTLNWLAAYAGSRFLPDIRMRADGDYRHDTEVKGEWLETFGTPDLIFEDRDSMVNFYRGRGITCVQVAPGDF